MYAEGGLVDLERLALSSGQARAFDVEVALDPIELAGQDYEPAGGGVNARLDVSRTSTGYALRLRFATELTGPCVRCLEPASTEVRVDAREVDQPSSAYRFGRWANDAVVLGLPEQPLCRPECAGLCAVCGVSLNDVDPEAHRHETGGDPRMAKLLDLKLDR